MLPKAFMKNLGVDFMSLVDKGANKRRFAIVKRAKQEDGTEQRAVVELGEDGKPVQKMPEEVIVSSLGSSFSGALEAIETQEQLQESRATVDEYFFLLKMVLKGVLEDGDIENKSQGIKKAIDEFKEHTVALFDGLPIKKQAELIEKGGNTMSKTQATNPAPENSEAEVEKRGEGGKSGGGAAGTSSNKQPEGQNRPSGDEGAGSQAGVGKTKGKLKKADLLAMLEKLEGDEVSIEDLEKSVGDRSEGAPATGEDTVSSNGDAATMQTKEQAPASDSAGGNGVAKADSGAGEENPDKSASAANRHDVALDGSTVSGIVEQFKKSMEASLEGKLGPVSDLLKGLEARVGKIESVTKMAGMSNADSFDVGAENEKRRSQVEKSEGDEWSQALDSFGTMKPAARSK